MNAARASAGARAACATDGSAARTDHDERFGCVSMRSPSLSPNPATLRARLRPETGLGQCLLELAGAAEHEAEGFDGRAVAQRLGADGHQKRECVIALHRRADAEAGRDAHGVEREAAKRRTKRVACRDVD